MLPPFPGSKTSSKLPPFPGGVSVPVPVKSRFNLDPTTTPLVSAPIASVSQSSSQKASFPEATTQALKDLGATIRNPGNVNKEPGNIRKTIIGSLKEAGSNFVQKAKAVLTNKDKTLSGQYGKDLDLVSATGGLVFSPITALFTAANDVPVLNVASKLISVPFTALGEVGTGVSNSIVESLPISKEAKMKIAPGLGEVVALASQIYLGKYVDPIAKISELSKRYGQKDAVTIMKEAQKLAEAKTVLPEPLLPFPQFPQEAPKPAPQRTIELKTEKPITIQGEPLKDQTVELPNLKQKVFKPESKITELKTQIDNLQSTIDQSPLKKLSKYAREGKLPEVTGTRKGGKFERLGDDIASELGFEYSEGARNAYEQYNASRLKLADLKSQLRETKSETFSDYTDTQLEEINRMAQETAQAVDSFQKRLEFAGSPKPIETGGSRMASRVFERIKAENPAIEGDVGYDVIRLKEDAQKAVDLIEKDKQKAFDIAMGKETSSEVTSTAVNIALAEKALQDGNLDLYARLVRNRSLEQTRRGQELVAERGSVTDNSTAKYVKEVIAARLDKLGKDYLSDIKNTFKRTSNKGKGMDALDREVKKVEAQIKSKKLTTKDALVLLDKLSCL